MKKPLNAFEVLALRRKLGPDKLREIGQAREHYNAGLCSRWDRYEDAIKAAYKGHPDRLVDCLRGQKPLADRDRDRLVTFVKRRRCWPPRLVLSRPLTADDYEVLADIVAAGGRKRGRILDAPAHRAARLARVLLSLFGPRTAVIDYACESEGDESGAEIESERVRNLLGHPRIRDTER